MAPLVTLTTDFGAGSGYPAQMKAVILRALPDAILVDVSHDVPPYDVLAGALLLEACVPWFPDQAVHCVVVDPGVGTSRRPLVVVDPHGRRFVGPDNGLFTPFLGPGARVFEIVHAVAGPTRLSATFHGRDLFAPVAAWLADGGEPEGVGPPVRSPVRIDWPVARLEGDRLYAECLRADPFGNLLTSIRDADLHLEVPAGGAAEVPHARVLVGAHPARFVRTFGEGRPGELLALVGSSGRVEIAVCEGSAARTFGFGPGTPVVVAFGTDQ